MAECMWCQDKERWTGKDRAGVRVYTCDKHKDKIESDLHAISRRMKAPPAGGGSDDAALTGELY